MALPELIPVEDSPGEDTAAKWPHYIERIYRVFCDQLANADLRFQGCPVRCRYKQPFDGKHASFWHAITDGPIEEGRMPDYPRCERIAWIPWVIENADDPDHVRWWENERSSPKHGRSTHVVLWLYKENYAVILQKRSDENGPTFYLLITSYCLKRDRLATFEKEWNAWNAS